MADTFESFPGIHPLEFVPERELLDAKKLVDSALEQRYQDELNIFHAEVFLDMSRKCALNDSGAGWAVYIISDGAEEDGDTMSHKTVQDAVVLYFPGSVDETGKLKKAPFVRMTTSELILVEDGKEFLTYDSCIDEDGDAFYRYGSFPMRESINQGMTSVPIFQYNDQGMIGCSEDFTSCVLPILGPKDDDNFKRDVVLTPFGEYNDIHTKLFVLGCMQTTYRKLQDAVLVAWQGMPHGENTDN